MSKITLAAYTRIVPPYSLRKSSVSCIMLVASTRAPSRHRNGGLAVGGVVLELAPEALDEAVHIRSGESISRRFADFCTETNAPRREGDRGNEPRQRLPDRNSALLPRHGYSSLPGAGLAPSTVSVWTSPGAARMALPAVHSSATAAPGAILEPIGLISTADRPRAFMAFR